MYKLNKKKKTNKTLMNTPSTYMAGPRGRGAVESHSFAT